METLSVQKQQKPIEKRGSGNLQYALDASPSLNLDQYGPSSQNGQLIQKRGSFKMQKTSSFSKKSSASRSRDFDQDAEDSQPKKQEGDDKSYLYRLLADFDRKKNYEETVIKIMNEMPVSKIKEADGCDTFGEQYPNNTKHKRTIFLDLDDTLVYVTIIRILHANLVSYEIEHQNATGRQMKMFAYLRPGIYTFLDTLSEHFEIVLFNNGNQEYTENLVKLILDNSPSGRRDYFSYVISKDKCSINDSGHEIKNIEHFCNFDSNREISDCLIVDNNIYSFQKHLTNGLLIDKFEGNDKDDWLEIMQTYIINKFTGDNSIVDVRKTISTDFGFENIVSNTRTSMIRQMMNKNLIVEALLQEDNNKQNHDQ